MKTAFKFGLALVGIWVALVLGEIGVRLSGLDDSTLFEPTGLNNTNFKGMEFNDEMGFFPRIGPGTEYGRYGCRSNDYDVDDRKGRERILFVGDSVTHRGALVRGLEKEYGDDKYEYWNAGVESFNTFQELELYKRYNHDIKPDRVVLTFHNNDFYVTPVARREGGRTVLYFPKHPALREPSGLLTKSALFRFLADRWYAGHLEQSRDDVKRELKELKEQVEADGAHFSVILWPVLSAESEWNKREKRSREWALEIFRELDVEYYDLLPRMKQAMEEGVPLRQTPEDTWHPCEGAGIYFAHWLKEQGLLQDGSGESG